MSDYITTHPWSWSGNGNDWMEYPRGINKDGRKLENHLYIQPNGEWTNTYELPKGSQILNPGERPQDLKPRKRISAWDEQLDYTQEPEPTYEKDRDYQHGPLPTPSQTLLIQWKNSKQSRKWESKQISWGQLMTAMEAHQKTGDAAMLRWEEMDGDDLEPISGDPLDALMEEEQEEIREESRQYQLSMLLSLMSAKEKEAITLNSMGLKRAEIAEALGCSEESAKTYLKRARKKAEALSPKTH